MAFVDTETLLQTFRAHPSVCTDTRKLRPGDLFWALKGEHFDGNQFAAQALESGAALAVVDDPAVIPDGDERFLLVENGLRALQALALAYRRTWRIPVIGLTGSNGKTTTKELLAAALRPMFRVHATAGNYNNHIGVPLTLLAAPEDSEIAIVEMGTNQPGDICELADMAEPDFGLVTNVGYAHIEKLLSLDGVKQEKGQLFEKVKARRGWIFVNATDHRVVEAAGKYLKLKTYGNEDADLSVEILDQSAEGMHVRLREKVWPDPLDIHTAVSGEHNALNIAAAAVIAAHLGVESRLIGEGIASYVPENHRSQLIERGGYRIWMDAYNANPSSMAAAVRHVMGLGAAQPCLIIGDMYELGDDSEAHHRQLGELIASLPPARVIGVGDAIQATLAAISGDTHHFPDTAAALPHIQSLVSDCDLLLIKASRGIGLEKLLEKI